jgi:hypothetical protein
VEALKVNLKAAHTIILKFHYQFSGLVPRLTSLDLNPKEIWTGDKNGRGSTLFAGERLFLDRLFEQLRTKHFKPKSIFSFKQKLELGNEEFVTRIRLKKDRKARPFGSYQEKLFKDICHFTDDGWTWQVRLRSEKEGEILRLGCRNEKLAEWIEGESPAHYSVNNNMICFGES